METEVNTNDMDLKLLKVRIDFLEAQLAAMKRELATPKASSAKKDKSKTKMTKYQSFDDLVLAFDDSKIERISEKSPVMESETVQVQQFLHVQYSKYLLRFEPNILEETNR